MPDGRATGHTPRPRGRVLLLAYHYPPMLGPASERAVSLVRHLPDAGWEPIVVTVAQGLYHRNPGYRGPPVRTVRTRSPEPSKLLAPLRRASERNGSDTLSEVRVGSAAGRLRRFVRDYVYVPDGQMLWIPFAVAAVRRVLSAESGPVALLSTSVPYSAHLAARAVAGAVGVPWVAEFRDPWSHVHQAIRPRSRPRRAIDATLERRVVQSADAVVLTSELTRQAMARNHPQLPEERLWLVRNGFEPLEEQARPPDRGDALELVYAGSVPPHVPIEPLLRGIDAVAGRHPGKIHLSVFSPRERWEAAASALGGATWLRLEGLVSPEEVRRSIATASANVLLCPGEAYEEHVAAKLMEYLGARRPVLAVVSASGEMAALGRDYGDMRLPAAYREDLIAQEVEGLLAEHARGELQHPVKGERGLHELTRKAQVAKLAEVLEFVQP